MPKIIPRMEGERKRANWREREGGKEEEVGENMGEKGRLMDREKGRRG